MCGPKTLTTSSRRSHRLLRITPTFRWYSARVLFVRRECGGWVTGHGVPRCCRTTRRYIPECHGLQLPDNEVPPPLHRRTAAADQRSNRCNVDLLKMIQLGLTFSDNNGNSPPECSTWQFNFKMSLTYLRTLTPQAALTSCVISQRRYVRAGLD